VRSAFLLCCAAIALARAANAAPVLRVCADPGNLPASNDRGDGFENHIARLIAADLHRDIQFVWAAEQRGFIRRFLLSGACDVVMGVPAGLAPALTTRPYYTSSYVMVTRARDRHRFASFDDAWLTTTRIGLPALGSDGVNTPPVMALARRGITQHVTGFPVLGRDSPQGRMVDAVMHGDIDVAFLWGPVAGYFAKPYGPALWIDPVSGDNTIPATPFQFSIAIGMRPSDTALRAEVQQALDHHAAEITALLRADGIPLVTQRSTR